MRPDKKFVKWALIAVFGLAFISLALVSKEILKFSKNMDIFRRIAGNHAIVTAYDAKREFLRVTLTDETLTCGTDACCEAAAQLFNALCKFDPQLILFIDAEFVSSAINPMDYQWTRILVGDTPVTGMMLDAHRMRIWAKIRNRNNRRF